MNDFNQPNSSKNTFPQSLPVVYKKAADALEAFIKNKKPLETSLNLFKKHPKIAYDLAKTALKYAPIIDYLIEELDILAFYEEEFKKETIVQILIADLLWGSQILMSDSKEVSIVKSLEQNIRETFLEAVNANHSFISPPLPCSLPVYVRVNTLVKSIDEGIQQFQDEGWKFLPFCDSYSNHLIQLSRIKKLEFMRDFHVPEVLVFPPGTNFREHPAFLIGTYLIQEKGSCLSSYLLNPKPGSLVLDACAGFGLQTNHIANILGNHGKIIALENHPERFEKLCDLVELSSVHCVDIFDDDIYDIHFGPEANDIKYILINPNCTYSGIFARLGNTEPEVRFRYQHSLRRILRRILHCFPQVKRVVYTVCSVYPEEGEMLVDEALGNLQGSYVLMNAKEMLWHEWNTPCIPGYICSNNCLRLSPGNDGCQGYFIAVFERVPAVPVPIYQEIPEPIIRPNINAYKRIEREIEKEFDMINFVNHQPARSNGKMPKQKLKRTHDQASGIPSLMSIPVHHFPNSNHNRFAHQHRPNLPFPPKRFNPNFVPPLVPHGQNHRINPFFNKKRKKPKQ
ncbi:probable 28S rRNA (cytosine-C(5))-methyltransferase [Trichogramma pretiosum]|uniref:probable 28S rRNA (cytosine-C(5))-methyltransferase n=1 Tax=Trichogramma pretiosum TaxID=7493 RepID=UPI0006C964B8|nr:probable 28S rRNA (cytosine-C(5))-methyltransferase [Trichogramma pretiosum]XP_014226712.1 probable 28S rRNA (cytosine-C(5))-methyltransferase [Trichogramma pretiosum]